MESEITKQMRKLMLNDCIWFENKFNILNKKMKIIQKEIKGMIEVLEIKNKKKNPYIDAKESISRLRSRN